MKCYTIIGGVNGVGKSSLTGVLKTQSNDLGRIVDVDKLAARTGSAIRGGKLALEQIEDCLRRGHSFTQETTLSGYRTERTAARARDLGYTVRLYYVGLDSPEECLTRIENRVRRGGHDVPSRDVLRRFSLRWQALSRLLPYCHEARFFDNGNGFEEVAEYRNGELIPKGSAPPAWLQDLAAFLTAH